MSMTRRQFMGNGAAVVWGLGQASRAVAPVSRCIVLDLGEHCSLRESVAGYRSAFAGTNRIPRPSLIVPAALEVQPPGMRAILSCLHAGGTVVLESGAAFTDERRFVAHRGSLRDHLQVHIEPPVDLWPRRTPYIDFTWPHPAKLRDFSRVVPLERRGHAAEIIASIDGLPVAIKRRSGQGTLIFLGSPLGPGLWAGDADAKRWLGDALLAAPQERQSGSCRPGDHEGGQSAQDGPGCQGDQEAGAVRGYGPERVDVRSDRQPEGA
jgi:hypothetical protein